MSLLDRTQEEALRDAYLRAVDDAFLALREAGGDAVEHDSQEVFTRTEEAGGRVTHGVAHVRVLSGRVFMYEKWPQLAQRGPVSTFLSSFNASLRSVSLQAGQEGPSTPEQLRGLFGSTFAHLARGLPPTLTPSVAEVNATWRGIVGWFFESNLPVVETVLLGNFDCAGVRVVLPGGLSIERIPDQELSRRVFELTRSGNIAQGQIHWRAHWNYEATREEYYAGRKAPSRLAALGVALRLMCAGDLQLLRPTHRCELPIVYSGERSFPEELILPGRKLVLDPKQAQELGDLVDRAVTADFAEYLPMLRLMETASARSEDDRIAKFVIALEGLLGGSQAPDIAYRLALRTSRLLAPLAADRERYFKILKIVYGLRSTIVHGSGVLRNHKGLKKLAALGVEPHALPGFLEDLLRRGLRLKLERPDDFTDEALDRLLLSG